MYPVTVIIPHYDEAPERLSASVRSILLAGAAEIVVVDDGSPVPPSTVPGARLVLTEHRGIAAALNSGIDEATQPWIASLGCGDTMADGRFEPQFAANELAVFGDWLTPDGELHQPAPTWEHQIWRDNQFSAATALVRSDVLRAMRWNEALRWGSDWEMAIVIHCAVGWTYVPGVAATCCEFPGGHTDRGNRSGERPLDIAKISRWARALSECVRETC